jgi:hypothetical protein
MIPRQLNERHLADLGASGITEEFALRNGCFSGSAEQVRAILGFNQTNSPGLVFPYPGTNGNGQKPFMRVKPDTPFVDENGRPAKYLSPKFATNRLYVPCGVELAFKDPSIPLYITEGEKKAQKAAQERLMCVALAGVQCWRGKGADGASRPIPDLDLIEWKKRAVFIVFDSDAAHNRNVRDAEHALAKELASRGATVRAYRLPGTKDKKVGLDDYLCAHTVQEFLQLPQEDPLKGKGKIDTTALVDRLEAQHLEPKGLIAEIRKLSDLKAFERKREVSRLILSDLKRQGTFYRTSTDALYFFAHATKTLLTLDSVEFARLITEVYGVNRSEEEFAYLLAELENEACRRGTFTEIRQCAYYNRDSGVLYVSNNQNQVYRLDGENITLVDNGTDGVLFLPDPMAEPFTYLDSGSSEESLLHRLLLDRINFSVSPHSLLTREEYQLLLYLYLLALVFESLHPTKPLALFTGPKGAGKTWTLKAVGLWLFGSHFNVTTLAKDKEDAFITTICARSFVAYDNVDGKIAWLNDRLATAATGQRIELRKLYTTNETAVYAPRCFVALTSRTPKFKRDDVVDRLLLFRVERLSAFQSEAALLEEIQRNRDALWTEYLDDLNEVVAGLQEQTAQLSTSHRMADFATFAQRVGNILGQENEVLAVLDKLGKDQSAFLLEDDPIAQALAAWLENSANQNQAISSGDLFVALSATAQGQGIVFPFKSAGGFGQRLKHLLSNLEDNRLLSRICGWVPARVRRQGYDTARFPQL